MNKFLIKESSKKVKGLFTTIAFIKNEVLFKFDGNNVSQDIATEKSLQIGTDLFVDITNHYSSFTNHNCNPNCYVKIAVNTAFLVALQDIDVGEELTFDYSLTSTEDIDSWSMDCNCSPFKCRKTISGFKTLPQEKQTQLIISGMAPKYLR